MRWIYNMLYGKRLERETQAYLQQIGSESVTASRNGANQLLAKLRNESGPKMNLATTESGSPFEIPLDYAFKTGMITGGMGSGKTYLALGVLKRLIDLMPDNLDAGLGVLDAKADLFVGAMILLSGRLDYLSKHDPEACERLRSKIFIYDFSSRDPIGSYNILARWPDTDPEFFALNRADILTSLLNGSSDKLSMGGVTVLQKILLLLSEFSLPITYADDVLHDQAFRTRLLSRCSNEAVTSYFSRKFAEVPKATKAALSRRLEGLFSSEGVKLSLSGDTAPDLRKLQDEGGNICLINCFGKSITRSVRRVLQGLVLSDIHSSVFARRNKTKPFLWLADEAQNFFLTPSLRDNMTDLLTMARAFGSQCVLLTQDMTSAVQDPRLLRILHSNIRWSASLRGDPSDCAFLKSALPVTGRRTRPKVDPFAKDDYYSLSEERGMVLDGIANLPDRQGYLWLKDRGSEAIRIRTQDVEMPSDSESLEALQKDASIGGRLTPEMYAEIVEQRNQQWRETATQPDLESSLKQGYVQTEGAAA